MEERDLEVEPKPVILAPAGPELFGLQDLLIDVGKAYIPIPDKTVVVFYKQDFTQDDVQSVLEEVVKLYGPKQEDLNKPNSSLDSQ